MYHSAKQSRTDIFSTSLCPTRPKLSAEHWSRSSTSPTRDHRGGYPADRFISTLLSDIQTIPGIEGVPGAYEMVVAAGQTAYAVSYAYVYYATIAFGVVAIIASCFLTNINKYIDNHVAVVMH